MGCKIDERDLLAIAFRHRSSVRQMLGYGIVECDFTTFHHVGEQQSREGFRDRADLEHRVAIYLPAANVAQLPARYDTLPMGIDYADDNPHALLLDIDALSQDFV